jgi:hypothetical protein
MSNRMLTVFALSLLGTAASLVFAEGAAEKGPKQSFETTKAESTPFASGGIIRINGSYGYLAVEGWDEPEVEVTVIKSTNGFYEPSQKPQEGERFERVHVVTERRSDKELVVTTTPPVRKSVFFFPRPLLASPRHGLTPDYRIHVPRNSKLVVVHDNGYVWVSDVAGDIEVRSHTGDMIVMLPDPGPYAIDASTGLGSVSSDFAGKGHRYLAGTRFAFADSDVPARRIFLRMGRGSITIKGGPSSGPVRKD